MSDEQNLEEMHAELRRSDITEDRADWLESQIKSYDKRPWRGEFTEAELREVAPWVEKFRVLLNAS